MKQCLFPGESLERGKWKEPALLLALSHFKMRKPHLND